MTRFKVATVTVTLTVIGVTGLVLPAGARQAGAPAGTASISGRVTDADTSAPLAGLKVGSRGVGWTETDAAGRYMLRAVPAGTVTVGLEGQYLAFALAIPRRVVVTAGADVTGVDLGVRLEGSVSGRVLDEAGDPVGGVRVALIGQGYSREGTYGADPEFGNELWRLLRRSVTTDDQGRYTLDGLRAGRTHRLLAHRPRAHDVAVSTAPADSGSRRTILAATYFPSADSFDSATPIVVHSLERLDRVDIIMRREPAFCVEATIVTDGAPAAMSYALEEEDVARLVTEANTTTPGWRITGSTRPDGRIRACDVYPGRFRLTADRAFSPWSADLRGVETIVIDRADVRGVQVVARAPLPIAGEVVLDGSRAADAGDAPRLRVALWPSSSTTSRAAAAISIPGSFAFSIARGIPNSVRVTGLPPTMYVKDVQLDGRSLAAGPLLAGPMEAEGVLRVMVAPLAASLTAVVAQENGTAREGVMVMVVPAGASSEAELAAGLRAGVTDETGVVRIDGLTPGAYDVLASTDHPPSVIQYPSERVRIEKTPETMALLMRARARGTRLDLRPGGDMRVTLRPTAWR